MGMERARTGIATLAIALAVLGSGIAAAADAPTGAWQPTPRAKAALRLPANREEGARTFALCAGCHRDDGAGDEQGLVPRIAGQHYSVIIRQLSDFQAGRRHDPRMNQAVVDHRLQSPQALADVATYVNLLKPRESVNLGGTLPAELGQRLYETNCAACHGGAAQGSDREAIPRLAGQRRAYLMRQFRDIGASLRPPVGRRHEKLLAPLEYQERDALADYLSRLR